MNATHLALYALAYLAFALPFAMALGKFMAWAGSNPTDNSDLEG